MRATVIAALATTALLATPLAQAADTYSFDKSHTDILVSWSHFGFSTTTLEFLEYEGTVTLDEDDPANSHIEVTFDLAGLDTDWQQRDEHFRSADFFDVGKHPMATFVSTAVEVTGEKSAEVMGDLTIKGITRPVTMDVRLNAAGPSPIVEGLHVAGFDATTTFKRSDFDLGMFAPHVSDEVTVSISTELHRQ